MFRFCINYLIGLSCLFWLENKQQAVLLVTISSVIFTATIYVITPFFSTSQYLPKLKRLAKLVIPLTFGLVWGSSTVIYWLNTVPQLISKPRVVEVDGYICSIPKQDSVQKINFDFCVDTLDGGPLSLWQKNKIKLTKYYPAKELARDLLAGTYWRFKAKLKPIHSRLNPGGFDYEKWLLSEGFIATGYIREEVKQAVSFSLKAKYHSVRQFFYQQLTAVIPKSANRGIVLALAMGERSAIDADQWQAVKGSGTSHLLAISGLHIGIAALWSYYLFLLIFKRLRFVIKKVPAQKLAQIGSLIGATCIALLSGFGYPAQRALIMLTIYLIAQWSGRALSLSKTLVLSVIVIVTVQPLAILTVSFWLSVMAVGLIVLLTSYKQSTNGIAVNFKSWLRINWFLFVGLMPITWAIFDSISLVGFAANLILIPLTSFLTTPIIYLGLIAINISDQFAHGLFIVADVLVGITYQIQFGLSQLNQTTSVSSLPIDVFVLLLAAILVLLMPSKLPGKSIFAPLILASFLIYTTSKNPTNFKMIVFDIGQGLAIHIRVGDKNLLFDTGYGNDQFSMAETSLIPYFTRQGIQNLDVVTISHSDSDHAGGLKAIHRDLLISTIYAGEVLGSKAPSNTDISIVNCHTAPAWRWSNVEFEFRDHLSINHSERNDPEGNNASCVLLITVFERQILLTGDIEKRAEQRLIDKDTRNKLKNIDLVVSPHHGSLTSSTEKMVNYLNPRFVVHSAGYANQWNFPRPEVVDRYLSVGAKNFTTHRDGALTIKVDKSGQLEITTERANRSHFWY